MCSTVGQEQEHSQAGATEMETPHPQMAHAGDETAVRAQVEAAMREDGTASLWKTKVEQKIVEQKITKSIMLDGGLELYVRQLDGGFRYAAIGLDPKAVNDLEDLTADLDEMAREFPRIALTILEAAVSHLRMLLNVPAGANTDVFDTPEEE